MKKLMLGFILLLSINKSFAGFPIGLGKWMLCPSYIYYSAESYWNNNRELNDYISSDGYSGKFTSQYLGLFGGYGINRDLDFLFKVPFVSNTFVEGNRMNTVSGIGDVMLGLRYFLNHYDYTRHLSVTGSIILPFYAAQSLKEAKRIDTIRVNNQLGFATAGLEVKLGYAGSFKTGDMKGLYWDIDGGFRAFLSSNGPTQFFTNLTMGFPLSDEVKMSGTLRGVSSTSPSANLITSSATLVNRDFDYIRAELAFGLKLTRSTQIWGGIFSDITGRNIGKGSGYFFTLVIKPNSAD